MTSDSGTSLREQMERSIAAFRTRVPDWDAFADARLPGYRRAQMRVIGSGASGKQDSHTIAPVHFTLSIMYVPVGEGNAPHTHEVEEVFFILQGHLTVSMEDGRGERVEATLGPWDCVSCPANVIHGYQNKGMEPVYMQVILGRATPDLMAYADPDLQQRRDEHLKQR